MVVCVPCVSDREGWLYISHPSLQDSPKQTHAPYEEINLITHANSDLKYSHDVQGSLLVPSRSVLRASFDSLAWLECCAPPTQDTSNPVTHYRLCWAQYKPATQATCGEYRRENAVWFECCTLPRNNLTPPCHPHTAHGDGGTTCSHLLLYMFDVVIDTRKRFKKLARSRLKVYVSHRPCRVHVRLMVLPPYIR